MRFHTGVCQIFIVFNSCLLYVIGKCSVLLETFENGFFWDIWQMRFWRSLNKVFVFEHSSVKMNDSVLKKFLTYQCVEGDIVGWLVMVCFAVIYCGSLKMGQQNLVPKKTSNFPVRQLIVSMSLIQING